MKAFLCMAVLIGSAVVGWHYAGPKPPCVELDAYCSRPSVSNLQAAMLCPMAGLARLGDEDNQQKCARILRELKK
jgi:hypothetical protein